MPAMKVTGQCRCGAIAYEAEVDPARVSSVPRVEQQ
jgi:hypothetical protein